MATIARCTVADAVAACGAAAESRLRSCLAAAGVGGHPARLALLAFKRERRLELWAAEPMAWMHVKTYPILAASGGPGPKRREGDRQVPEGLYRIVGLNPNSRYHLSLRLDYPNAFDRTHAAREGRSDPGGDIFIHGGARSVGCLAMGDPAVEELFVLADRVGIVQVTVIIAPNDLRRSPPATELASQPPWVAGLYDAIARALARFPPPPNPAQETQASPT